MQIGPFYIEIEQAARGIAIVMMAVGLLVIPILPGLMIIWVSALGYGIAAGFGVLGWVMFALITVLMLAGSILDNVLMGAQAHKEGAPWWVVIISMASAIIGSFVIPIPIIGGILAALLVLFLIEWIRLKDARKALVSMRGMLVGCGWAAVFRIIIGLVMIGLWLIWAWA
ncbi:MAG: DUF456 domain-containing protein [Chloroflexi bacterium]|nr:DUF456 domain-containing protein [Chloroflexota bacterium]